MESIYNTIFEKAPTYLQSNFINLTLLLSGNFLFGHNFLTPELCIIPIHVSVKKIHCNPEKVNSEFGPNPE